MFKKLGITVKTKVKCAILARFIRNYSHKTLRIRDDVKEWILPQWLS